MFRTRHRLQSPPGRCSTPQRLSIALGVASLIGGCAGLRASSARKAYLRDHLAARVYSKTLEEIQPVARQLLFERGYGMAGRDTDGRGSLAGESAWRGLAVGQMQFAFGTDWRWDHRGTGTSQRSRYMVQGVKVGQNRYRMEMTRIIETVDDMGHTSQRMVRDWEMELQLMERVDPAAAAQLSAGAEAAAQAARSAD